VGGGRPGVGVGRPGVGVVGRPVARGAAVGAATRAQCGYYPYPPCY
jgi:hypothetical protein